MFQKLEPRQLLAVTVIETYPSYYEIHGTQGNDSISVTVSQQYETMTVNGDTYYGVGYIAIAAYEGEDVIRVVTVDGPGYIAAGISAGGGDDQVMLNFDGAVWGGPGNDMMHLSDAFRGEAYGEQGSDRIYISGNTYDAEIIGGPGDDLINCSGNNAPVLVRGGSGNDTIIGSAFNDRLYGDEGTDWIYAGAGNDALFSAEYAQGGDGYDVLYGYAVYSDSIEQFVL